MLSIGLYLCFFLGGLYIDSKKTNKNVRTAYIIALFLFLCFGYMTGSDWRAYELQYYDAETLYRFSTHDKGFYAIYYFLSLYIKDFFLALGLLKCLYLFSLIALLRYATDRWLGVLSIMFAFSLLFMLVNNPLRFMAANIFVNFGLIYALKKDVKKFLIISIPGVLFHPTTIILILTILCGLLAKKIVYTNKHVLFAIYLIIAFIFSNLEIVQSLYFLTNDTLQDLGTKSYESYEVRNNNSFFTIGSLLRVIYGFIIIYNREIILKAKNGEAIFAFTLVSLYFSRLVLIVPTGFRLAIPVGIFYAISITIIIYSKVKTYAYFFIIALSIMLVRDLYNTYVYIPYSNSIPYIITGHKSYPERDMYNRIEYSKRTGNPIYTE